MRALSHAKGERAEADRRREAMRIEAIAREYRAKLDDLRHNYALRVTVEWVQALELYVPVQRFDVLIRRSKGERVIQLDWHPSAMKSCIWPSPQARVHVQLAGSPSAAPASPPPARAVGAQPPPAP